MSGFRINSWQHGTLLWDLESDPAQTAPIVDDAVEREMIALLLELLRENDAPESVYARLGLPVHGDADDTHLRAGRDARRAKAIAVPLPRRSELPALELLETPVHELLADEATHAVLVEHMPWLVTTELITATPWASVLGMAAAGAIDAGTLVAVADDLALVAAPVVVS
jgi:hypothetical protein